MQVELQVPLQGAWGRRGGHAVEQQRPDIGQRQVAGMEFRRKRLPGWIEPCLTFDLGTSPRQAYILNVPHRLFDAELRSQRVKRLPVDLSLLYMDGPRSGQTGSSSREVEMAGR